MTDERPDLTALITARPASAGQKYCLFVRGDWDFGVDVLSAREVLTGEPLTRVPQAPPLLAGVINLRGDVLPLVQLEGLFGFPNRPYTLNDHVLVLSSDGVDIGLIVDRVREVRAIEPAEVVQFAGPTHDLLRGCCLDSTRVLHIVDGGRIVATALAAVKERFKWRVSTADPAEPIGPRMG